MEILVVEDEDAIADFLRRGLEAEGHRVVIAGDGVEGERLALAGGVDMVILDRLLPGRDGMEVLAAVRRAKPTLPVIVLSARGGVADRVEGLDEGATDYMAKPFSFGELAARVRAHLRPQGDDSTTVLEAGGIRLDLLSRRVEGGEQSVRLSERETELLALLMRRVGQVCATEEILSAAWGYEHDPGTNIVQVYIGYLRRRFDQLDSAASIETVRSVGYRLVER